VDDYEELQKVKDLLEKVDETEDDPGFKAFSGDELKRMGKIDTKKKFLPSKRIK
jgi:hypothetical protein